ncbi:tRNA (guanine-N(7)-)-methyltransferase [Penicillium chermesinum]|uniref:tRNA (guanine-N(7)-)-methyltransferase n=1 Tax=Penicillium chermesinum TaxID=63820 RepID=A0A9W9NCJ0_9EURO|nr:tRNA (guanine-N(7)-)-methyltransferase [Penicillium chermesinum]KAJ5217345.1 tRNA (guanine-N(7)-)-methyltransferase [Penicillium chermesinum]KAJ6171043.1 tRNA (guanine-N(7)-)-methyltransferase [Penicillium chermesinum]
MVSQPAPKRQKREEYRRKIHEQHEAADGAKAEVQLPQKRFFRQRAHANPFSDHQLDYPLTPAHMDWSSHYPAFVDPDTSKTTLSGGRKLVKDVEVVDIGCGFGGLLVGLAPLLPDTLMVGMEIRVSVLEFVTSRIKALRLRQQYLKNTSSQDPAPASEPANSPQNGSEAPEDEVGTTTSVVPGNYENISGIRANTMKFLPNFFERHQLSKIFICFPDPHFKARKHKARIVSEYLNAEYAYVLRPGGLLYTITDVEEYHHWILKHFHVSGNEGEDDEEVPSIKDLWERVSEEEVSADPCAQVMACETEESKKVTRNNGNKYVAVFRRKADPEWPA